MQELSVEFWIAIVGLATALVTAIGGWIKFNRLEIQIDGRLTQLLALTAKSSKAEGFKEGSNG